MTQMSAVDRYAAAWRERRRRIRAFKATQLAFFPILLVAAYVCSKRPSASDEFVFTIAIWFIGYIVVGVWLNRFRCPRCGNLYYWRVQLKGAMGRQKEWRSCHYCGLPQDAAPE
jgi:fatty-acid desaturase